MWAVVKRTMIPSAMTFPLVIGRLWMSDSLRWANDGGGGGWGVTSEENLLRKFIFWLSWLISHKRTQRAPVPVAFSYIYEDQTSLHQTVWCRNTTGPYWFHRCACLHSGACRRWPWLCSKVCLMLHNLYLLLSVLTGDLWTQSTQVLQDQPSILAAGCFCLWLADKWCTDTHKENNETLGF